MTMAMLAIFARSVFESLIFGYLRIFPQFLHNSSSVLELHVGQGFWGLGFLTNFSVVTRRMRVRVRGHLRSCNLTRVWLLCG